MRACLMPSEPVDEQHHHVPWCVLDRCSETDRIAEPLEADRRAGRRDDIGKCAGRASARGGGGIRTHAAYRSRAAVACDSAAAKLSAWATTSAPSAASETRRDRSSLLAVPV